MKKEPLFIRFAILLIKICLIGMAYICYQLLQDQAYPIFTLCVIMFVFIGFITYKIQVAAKEVTQ